MWLFSNVECENFCICLLLHSLDIFSFACSFCWTLATLIIYITWQPCLRLDLNGMAVIRWPIFVFFSADSFFGHVPTQGMQIKKERFSLWRKICKLLENTLPIITFIYHVEVLNLSPYQRSDFTDLNECFNQPTFSGQQGPD